MTLGVAELIEMASSFYTLHPGDVVFTGTPEGVSPIEPGDEIVATIQGIGSMAVRVQGGRRRGGFGAVRIINSAIPVTARALTRTRVPTSAPRRRGPVRPAQYGRADASKSLTPRRMQGAPPGAARRPQAPPRAETGHGDRRAFRTGTRAPPAAPWHTGCTTCPRT